MRKNYISPEMTVKTFSKAVHIAADTSAIGQAKQYLDNHPDVEVRNILVMK